MERGRVTSSKNEYKSSVAQEGRSEWRRVVFVAATFPRLALNANTILEAFVQSPPSPDSYWPFFFNFLFALCLLLSLSYSLTILAVFLFFFVYIFLSVMLFLFCFVLHSYNSCYCISFFLHSNNSYNSCYCISFLSKVS